MKTLPELTEELVDIMYELEKIKYSRPERKHGWVRASYIFSHGLENGLGKRQIAKVIQDSINEAKQEMSDLCAKVEA